MTSGFHNFNSNIQNQVIGTLNIGGDRDGEMVFIQQQLDTILARLKTDVASSKADVENVIRAVDEVRRELASKSPKADVLDQSLKVIGGISSFASFVGQIRAFLPGMF